jgi:hypothetical protein
MEDLATHGARDRPGTTPPGDNPACLRPGVRPYTLAAFSHVLWPCHRHGWKTEDQIILGPDYCKIVSKGYCWITMTSHDIIAT